MRNLADLTLYLPHARTVLWGLASTFVVSCGYPATPEVTTTQDRVTVNLDHQGHAPEHLLPQANIYVEDLTNSSRWGYYQAAWGFNPSAEYYSPSFPIEPHLWRPGRSGHFARFIVTNPTVWGEEVVVIPYDTVCAERYGQTYREYLCRQADNGYDPALAVNSPVYDGGAAVEDGLHFNACTSDFLPSGQNRRSYCDRVHFEVTTPEGDSTKRIAEYLGEYDRVTFHGDRATVLAVHRYSFPPDSQLSGGVTEPIHNSSYSFNTRFELGPVSREYVAGPRSDAVHVLDVGECSLSIPWATLIPPFLPEAVDLIEEETESQSGVRNAVVASLRITARPTRPLGSAPDTPRDRRYSLLIFTNILADLSIGGFDADVLFALDFEIAGNKVYLRVDYASPLRIQSGLAPRVRAAFTGLAGTRFDITDDVQPALTALGIEPRDIRRTVSTVHSLHLVLAETGDDPNYADHESASRCGAVEDRFTEWAGVALTQRWWHWP